MWDCEDGVVADLQCRGGGREWREGESRESSASRTRSTRSQSRSALYSARSVYLSTYLQSPCSIFYAINSAACFFAPR